MHLDMSKDQQSFKNISLSFRGAERQPPSIFGMALRFSAIMERQSVSGVTGSTESRLRKVVQEFNSSKGLHIKHQVDSDKERSILNLIIGSCKEWLSRAHVFMDCCTCIFHASNIKVIGGVCQHLFCQEARHLISQHLSFTKWKDSALSSEQLKSTRWLLGARPKGLPENFAEILTVTPLAQEMLFELHINQFIKATRRIKASARARVRASPDEFDRLVDYACVFAALRNAAKKESSDKAVDGKLCEAFLAKCLD